MCSISMYFTLGLKLFILIVCTAANTIHSFTVSYFEYGIHIEGEEASFAVDDIIPSLVPHYSVNVTPMKPHLEQRFTYLRVEYISPMSYVDIIFEPETFLLSFNVRFPFMAIPYGVVGYSLKLPRSRIWIGRRKSLTKPKCMQNMSLEGHS